MGSTSVRLDRKGKGGCGLNPVLGICLWISEYGDSGDVSSWCTVVA